MAPPSLFYRSIRLMESWASFSPQAQVIRQDAIWKLVAKTTGTTYRFFLSCTYVWNAVMLFAGSVSKSYLLLTVYRQSKELLISFSHGDSTWKKFSSPLNWPIDIRSLLIYPQLCGESAKKPIRPIRLTSWIPLFCVICLLHFVSLHPGLFFHPKFVCPFRRNI